MSQPAFASSPMEETALESESANRVDVGPLDEEEASAWRGELSAKLNRYRSKRKIRPPRYPSLSLPFDMFTPSVDGVSHTAQIAPSFEPLSDQALALDGMVRMPPVTESDVELRPSFEKHLGPVAEASSPSPVAAHPVAKIIEFPRFAWGPPVAPADQLAEPVIDRPRILDVPEDSAAPLPALGGIMMEADEKHETEKRPGIDFPLQSAPMNLRIIAAGIDGLIVAAASAVFAYIFWKVAAVRPPQTQMIALTVGVPCVLWAVYQFLLIVYASTSPGLRAAGLELACFDGMSTSRKLRRWRVLASYLSAVSLGMGYAWLFLDEDALCWHDRITHTYLAPKKTDSGQEKSMLGR